MTSPIGSFLRVTISKGSIGARKGRRPHRGLKEGALKQRIRELGERLDSHRKRQQALHPDLTLTGPTSSKNCGSKVVRTVLCAVLRAHPTPRIP